MVRVGTGAGREAGARGARRGAPAPDENRQPMTVVEGVASLFVKARSGPSLNVTRSESSASLARPSGKFSPLAKVVTRKSLVSTGPF